MSRVLRYTALVILLAAGVLMAGNSDDATCRMYIVNNIGDVVGLPCTAIDVCEDGECIVKIINDEDGFGAEVLYDGEKYEFDNKESFEAFLAKHPELEKCVDVFKDKIEGVYDEPTEHSDDTRFTE